MKLHDVPVVASVVEAGADDSILDALLLLGPVVVVLVVLFGRTVVTEGVALAYIGVLVGHTLYRGVE